MPCASSCARATAARSRLRSPAARVVGREVRVDLLADLVAAAARARAERGDDGPVAADLAQRAHALVDDPARERPPAAVQRGDGALGGEQDRQAVGDEDDRGGVGQRGRLAVLVRVGPLGRRRLGRAPDASRRGPGARNRSAATDGRRSPPAGAGSRSTFAGASSVSRPRFSDANGPLETPPRARREDGPRVRQVGDDLVVLPAEGGQLHGVKRVGPRASWAARSGARPSSIATVARASPSPTAAPVRPAATRSSPVIASRRWRTSSSQRRAPASPAAASSCTVSSRSRRKRRHSSASPPSKRAVESARSRPPRPPRHRARCPGTRGGRGGRRARRAGSSCSRPRARAARGRRARRARSPRSRRRAAPGPGRSARAAAQRRGGGSRSSSRSSLPSRSPVTVSNSARIDQRAPSAGSGAKPSRAA